MSEPLDLSAWVDRLEAAETDLQSIALVGDLARLQDVQGRLPGAWILPAEDSATAPASEPVLHQRVRCRVSVILALRTFGDATQGRAVDQLRPLRAQVMAALVGWQPPGSVQTVSYSGGRRLGPMNNAMWWEDYFETAWTIRR